MSHGCHENDGGLHSVCCGFDFLRTVANSIWSAKWITTRKAPDQIIGARVWDGKVAGTRLLCQYQQVATYKGTGGTDDAANYTCKAP